MLNITKLNCYFIKLFQLTSFNENYRHFFFNEFITQHDNHLKLLLGVPPSDGSQFASQSCKVKVSL